MKNINDEYYAMTWDTRKHRIEMTKSNGVEITFNEDVLRPIHYIISGKI